MESFEKVNDIENEEDSETTVVELMSPEGVANAFFNKDSSLVFDKFDSLTKTISEMQDSSLEKIIDLSFDTEEGAIKMRNFLQGNSAWFKDTFGIDINEIDQNEKTLKVDLESK